MKEYHTYEDGRPQGREEQSEREHGVKGKHQEGLDHMMMMDDGSESENEDDGV